MYRFSKCMPVERGGEWRIQVHVAGVFGAGGVNVMLTSSDTRRAFQRLRETYHFGVHKRPRSEAEMQRMADAMDGKWFEVSSLRTGV